YFADQPLGDDGDSRIAARRVIRRRLCWAVMRIPGCRDCTTWRQEEPMTPDDQPVGLRPETAVICAGRPSHADSGPLNVPVVLASNFHASPASAAGTGGGGRAYARTDATPTWEALERAVGQVEGGHAVAF